jgi:Fur family ferric uptake transcriptional regulator
MTSKERISASSSPSAQPQQDALLGRVTAAAEAENRLRQAGVRVTDARLKVLAALIDATSACSHQDMQDMFADMDRVTLYRALDCLTENGLAHKIAGDDRVFRYNSGAEQSVSADHGGSARGHAPGALGRHQHGHFKCTRCAKVFCLDGEALWPAAPLTTAIRQPTLRQQLQAVVQETLGQGFKAHDIELTIKGFCADCSG